MNLRRRLDKWWRSRAPYAWRGARWVVMRREWDDYKSAAITRLAKENIRLQLALLEQALREEGGGDAI